MKNSIIVVLMLVAGMFMNSVKANDEHGNMKEKKHDSAKAAISQKSCPVMGGKINAKYYADVKGKRVYVCCPGCIAKVKKAPEKYIKALKKKGEKLQAVKSQVNCPVMGGKINKKLYVDVKGKRIYVCCAGCIGAIKKDPAKYISKLKKAGVTIEKVKPAKAAVKQ